jgi:hypothetical protein
MSLFQLGKFTSHSGNELNWKLECDALTDDDWDCLAKMISDRIMFHEVVGIPRGGNKLASALQKYCETEKTHQTYRLVVDDVWTTGTSMLEVIGEDDFGYVVFARQRIPPLYPVRALFTMDIL